MNITNRCPVSQKMWEAKSQNIAQRPEVPSKGQNLHLKENKIITDQGKCFILWNQFHWRVQCLWSSNFWRFVGIHS